MIICVDAGNTSTKVAGVTSSGVHSRRTFATAALDDGHSLAEALRAVSESGGEAAEAVAVSSVVRGAVDAVRAAAPVGDVIVVDHTARLPLRLSVAAPETVGPDRICAAAGAVDAAHPDAVVVDIGSAVTVDRVRALEFIGGAIMPGPQMMLRALGEYTSRLPALTLDDVGTLFPDSPQPTPNAIAFGVGAAVLGGILEAVRRLSADIDPVPVWVTGGLAETVATRLPRSWNREPDLTLHGLFRVAQLSLSAEK